MDKFRVFVYMLIRDASLKQRIPCIMRISISELFQREKSAHYTRVNTVLEMFSKLHVQFICTQLNDNYNNFVI